MNNLNEKKIALIMIIIIISFISLVDATNIGVSPASLSYKKVLRGGYSEKSVVISIDSSKKIDLELIPRGDIANWINFSSFNISASRDKPVYLKLSVNPPRDIPNGNYSGFLRVISSGLGESIEGNAVGIVRSSIDLSIIVEVIDVELIDCSATNYLVNSVEEGENLIFNLKVDNNGNIRLKPKVIINVWDQDQISILKSQDYIGPEIFPTTSGNFLFRLDSKDLKIGQYWVDISVPECYSSSTLTFDVLEEGSLKADGSILGIVINKTGNAFQTIPMKVLFKNTGMKETSAQFKGKISLNDRVEQILESEKINVPVGEINEYNFYFTPEKIGKYVVSGRVYYSSKKTFEASSIIEIFGRKSNINSIIIFLIYFVLISLIIFMILKIRHEKRRYTSKIRKIWK
jgi:hypothetical protein